MCEVYNYCIRVRGVYSVHYPWANSSLKSKPTFVSAAVVEIQQLCTDDMVDDACRRCPHSYVRVQAFSTS